ncbi:MAG: hypothetical protein JST84_15055 [Acidobacteria bacterium]|nr:hypothetical protein [Acidobacteriota bacterium]
MKILCCISVLLCMLAVSGGATRQQNQSASQAQGKPPQFEIEKYQFGILKRGPNWTAESTPETTKIQEGHMANINRMAKLGKLVAAGPIAGNGELRGIFIFKAVSLAEANALAAEDPAIKAGRLVLETMEWSGQKGIGLKVQNQLKAGIEPKYTMTKYYLALLSKGDQATAPSSPEKQNIQLSHLWYIRRQLDAKSFVAAGPFAGNQSLLGIFVIAANSPAEAQKLAEADPAIAAGHLKFEIHTWWSAKETWLEP